MKIRQDWHRADPYPKEGGTCYCRRSEVALKAIELDPHDAAAQVDLQMEATTILQLWAKRMGEAAGYAERFEVAQAQAALTLATLSPEAREWLADMGLVQVAGVAYRVDDSGDALRLVLADVLRVG